MKDNGRDWGAAPPPVFDRRAECDLAVGPAVSAVLRACIAAEVPCLVAVCTNAYATGFDVKSFVLTTLGEDRTGWLPLDFRVAALVLEGAEEVTAVMSAVLLGASGRVASEPPPFDRSAVFLAEVKPLVLEAFRACDVLDVPAVMAFLTGVSDTGRAHDVAALEGANGWSPRPFARVVELLSRAGCPQRTAVFTKRGRTRWRRAGG